MKIVSIRTNQMSMIFDLHITSLFEISIRTTNSQIELFSGHWRAPSKGKKNLKIFYVLNGDTSREANE